jgi:cobalamin synthase
MAARATRLPIKASSDQADTDLQIWNTPIAVYLIGLVVALTLCATRAFADYLLLIFTRQA